MSFEGLAPKQNVIWSLRRKGLEPVEIARRLKTSRQFVHQTLNTADSKVSAFLSDTAQANRIEIQSLDIRNGILVGFHRGLETPAVISYSGEQGVQVWYWHERAEACEACEQVHRCKSYLLNEAEEREIELTEDERKLPPARLAHVVFSRLTPGLKS